MTPETNSLDTSATIDRASFDFWRTRGTDPALEGDHTSHVTAYAQHLLLALWEEQKCFRETPYIGELDV